MCWVHNDISRMRKGMRRLPETICSTQLNEGRLQNSRSDVKAGSADAMSDQFVRHLMH